jgi:hypothetical protein
MTVSSSASARSIQRQPHYLPLGVPWDLESAVHELLEYMLTKDDDAPTAPLLAFDAQMPATP